MVAPLARPLLVPGPITLSDDLEAYPLKCSLCFYPHRQEKRHQDLAQGILAELKAGRMKAFWIPEHNGLPGSYVAATLKAMRRRPPHPSWNEVPPERLEALLTTPWPLANPPPAGHPCTARSSAACSTEERHQAGALSWPDAMERHARARLWWRSLYRLVRQGETRLRTNLEGPVADRAFEVAREAVRYTRETRNDRSRRRRRRAASGP